MERTVTDGTEPAATRRRMSAAARREQLIDVTADLVIENGFPAVTVEAIAARAGITRAVIYQHFGALDALLEATIDREMTRAREHVSVTTPTRLTPGEPRDQLLNGLDAYLHAVRDHPRTWQLVLTPPLGAPERLRAAIDRGRRSVLARLAGAVGSVLDAGEAGDAELAAHLLSAVADEYARLLLTDPERYPIDRLLRHARRLLGDPALAP